MKRNHLSSIQSQNMYVSSSEERKDGHNSNACPHRLKRYKYHRGKEIQCKSKGIAERERERKRERVRENEEERRNYTYFTQYTCRYMNVGMNFISIFSKFSAIML